MRFFSINRSFVFRSSISRFVAAEFPAVLRVVTCEALLRTMLVGLAAAGFAAAEVRVSTGLIAFDDVDVGESACDRTSDPDE